MDIDLSRYFDTPEREHSYALLTRRPHLETGLYFGMFLLGGFPLLLLFELGYPLVWYLKKSVENGRPCCRFPDRKPLLILRQKPDAMEKEPVWTWTENLPPPEPCAWDSEEERQTAEFLKDKLVSPALHPYVQPDTPLCLLAISKVFAFCSVPDYKWRAVAKHYAFGLSSMNRINRLLNESPYEKRTFRDLVSLILTLDRTERKNNDFGCLLSLLPLPFYFLECLLAFYTWRFFSPWLGLVLFPLQYMWSCLWIAIWPGC